MAEHPIDTVCKHFDLAPPEGETTHHFVHHAKNGSRIRVVLQPRLNRICIHPDEREIIPDQGDGYVAIALKDGKLACEIFGLNCQPADNDSALMSCAEMVYRFGPATSAAFLYQLASKRKGDRYFRPEQQAA